MTVDPVFQAILDSMREAGFPTIGTLSAAELRAATRVPISGQPAVAEVRDFIIPADATEIPARLYRPAAAICGVVVYFHGGGWTIGHPDDADTMLRLLANATHCTIISVDYRLAPEHPFPAAVEDAYAAIQFASANGLALTECNDAPLIVMGDSAGGNLSAVVCQMAREASGPAIALQVLLYPATECDEDSPDLVAFEPPFLSRAEIAWFLEQYIPSAQREDPRFAPARAGSLAELPPAIIVTAEYDLLAAQGRRYAEKLRSAGNEVTLIECAGAIHGFMTMSPMSPSASKVLRDIAAAVGQATKPAGRESCC